jgi:Sulfotransferase domain
MKPNFLVIGAAKCATTTIRSLLGRHPDVFMAPTETQFFNEDSVFARGFAWYESLFAGSEQKAVRGEGCNGYTMKEAFPRAFDRLTAYAPRLKLIYLVRDPFERIESFWMELRSQHPDYVHHDFNKAVDVNRDWLTDSSNYLAQLEPYQQFYGDESIRVVFYEDFCAEPDRVIKDCFRFLGVDPHVEVGASTAWLNESDGKCVASPILSQLRSIGIYRRAVDRLPFGPRDRIARTLFYRKIRQWPEWHPETRAWVTDLLRSDLRRFLLQHGKMDDFWNLGGVLDVVNDAVVEKA